MFTEHDIERNGEVAWKHGGLGTIATVKAIMKKNDILVTRKAYEVKGGLFDQQIMKKGKGQVAIKGSDERLGGADGINKYGGYNSAKGAYFMLVESKDKKGNLIRTIEFIPLYLKKKVEGDKEWTLKYLSEDRGLLEPRICLEKIKTDALFVVDGFKMWLSGRKPGRLIFKGANQLILSEQDARTLKKTLKYVQRLKENKCLKISAWDEIYTKDLLKLYDTFLYKLEHTIYGVRMGAQAEMLTNSRDKFIDLSDESKCIILVEILHIFQCNSITSNLSNIGGGKEVGKITMNNNITKCESISIINCSPAGIYEQKIDLLKV